MLQNNIKIGEDTCDISLYHAYPEHMCPCPSPEESWSPSWLFTKRSLLKSLKNHSISDTSIDFILESHLHILTHISGILWINFYNWIYKFLGDQTKRFHLLTLTLRYIFVNVEIISSVTSSECSFTCLFFFCFICLYKKKYKWNAVINRMYMWRERENTPKSKGLFIISFKIPSDYLPPPHPPPQKKKVSLTNIEYNSYIRIWDPWVIPLLFCCFPVESTGGECRYNKRGFGRILSERDGN